MKFTVRENTIHIGYDDGTTEELPCAVGKNGVTPEADKREGDWKTPTGEYELLDLYYRKDKVGGIESGLPTKVITKECRWSDDVDHQYNEYVKWPFDASHEELWRDDDVYDLMITTSHNTFPPVAPMGSAIFFHVARYEEDGSMRPTAGCVAIDKADMLRIAPKITKGSTLKILDI
jgi:L,D-peptidoglycan transpeptidase YkuD (ErfK/YbiS/YcfS/YnhG family)